MSRHRYPVSSRQLPRLAYFAQLQIACLRSSSDAPAHWTMAWPVMLRPCGPRRKAIRLPRPRRGRSTGPSAAVSPGCAALPGSASIGVSVGPGATTLTVIARSTSSAAHDRAMPVDADLVAAYWLLPAFPVIVRLPTSTMRPPSTHAFGQRVDQILGGRDMNRATSPGHRRPSAAPSGAERCTPAACTTASRAPSLRCAAPQIVEVSQIDWHPAESVMVEVDGSRRLRPVTASRRSSSCRTVAAPIPELAPVTTAAVVSRGARLIHSDVISTYSMAWRNRVNAMCSTLVAVAVMLG